MSEQRLIDANALIRALIRKEPFSDCARVVIVECMEEVRHAPTIEERKKGKWERHNTYHGDDVSGFVDPDWRCPECGGQANVNVWGMYDLTNFCPNCGALMGGTP